MKELFPEESVKKDSPRLAWIKKHKIQTHLAKHMADAGEDDPWSAWIGDAIPPDNPDELGYGNTEDDAILDLAKGCNLKLWNEEK